MLAPPTTVARGIATYTPTLRRLLNTIKPGLVTNKIHLTKIKYHQMVCRSSRRKNGVTAHRADAFLSPPPQENIEHFLQGCQALGTLP